MVCRLHRNRGDIDRDAWTYSLHPVDDDKVTSIQTAANHSQTVDNRPERDGPVLDRTRWRDDEYKPLVQIGAHGAVLDQDAAVARRAGKSKTHEEARREAEV